MVDHDVIVRRIEKLKEYLKILKRLKKAPKKDFLDDPFVYGVADRFLHLAIECLLDIGNHIISDQNFEKPVSYSEVFKILQKEKVISKQLYSQVADMAAFRNVLVHDYMEIDHKLVFDIVNNKLPLLEKLAVSLAKFVL